MGSGTLGICFQAAGRHPDGPDGKSYRGKGGKDCHWKYIGGAREGLTRFGLPRIKPPGALNRGETGELHKKELDLQVGLLCWLPRLLCRTPVGRWAAEREPWKDLARLTI